MVEFFKWLFGIKEKTLPVKKLDPPTSNNRVLANKPAPQPALKTAKAMPSKPTGTSNANSSSSDTISLDEYNLAPLYESTRHVASVDEGISYGHSHSHSHDSHFNYDSGSSSHDSSSSGCDSGSCSGGCD